MTAIAKQRVPLPALGLGLGLGLVTASPSGEDPDFNMRFREQRARRWLHGIRLGMSLTSMVSYRLGLSREIRFRGIPVDVSDNQVTLRLIEDIWMRGEYDIPGFIPRPGWRVCDIGANVGIFAMLAAARGAQVTCFEAFPDSFTRLKENTAEWKAECHNEAILGRARGPVDLYVHERHTRHSVVPPSGESRQQFPRNSVKVPSMAITDILTEPYDLLKVDCEGAEFEIFACVGENLRNARRIIAEVHAQEGDPNELRDHIACLGFNVQMHDAYPGLGFHLITAVRQD